MNIFFEQTWYNISLHSDHEVLLKVLQGQYLALVEKYKQKDEKHLTILITLSFTLRPCRSTDFSPISQIELRTAENIIFTASEQQTVLTSTSHLQFHFHNITTCSENFEKEFEMARH